MIITRRAFLSGLMAAPIVVQSGLLMSISANPMLKLYSDGMHDDTMALNAAMRGEDVIDLIGVVSKTEDGHVRVTRGNFLISDTVNIPFGGEVTGNTFDGRGLAGWDRPILSYNPEYYPMASVHVVALPGQQTGWRAS